MNCYFMMTKQHTALADDIAYSRFVDATRNNRAHVGHLPDDDTIWSYVRGCRFELAFYLWLGGNSTGTKWNSFFMNATPEQLSLPEIEYRGRSIDVKLRPNGWDDFIVRQQSLKADVNYVLASDDDYPRCVFHGWMTGLTVATCRIGGRREIPGYVIGVDHPEIKDCMMLKDDRYKIPWVNPIYAASWTKEHMTDAERAGYPNGFVGFDADGRFLHFCACGAEASFGYNVSLQEGKLGQWFCLDHQPPPPEPKPIVNEMAVPVVTDVSIHATDQGGDQQIKSIPKNTDERNPQGELF